MATEAKAMTPRRLLKAFFEARGIKVTADAIRMWIDALKDLTEAELEFALRRFNRDCTDFPTPAAVRRFAGPKGLSDEQRAAHAWDVVAATMRDHGAYRSVNFDDRIVNAVIRQYGGWERLCSEERDQLIWIRKRFVESYVACARTGIGDASPLPGIAERENGFAREAPLLIDCELPTHAMHKRLAYTTPAELPLIEGPVATRQVSAALAARMKSVTDARPKRLEVAELTDDERKRLKERKLEELRGWIRAREEGLQSFEATLAAVGKETQNS